MPHGNDDFKRAVTVTGLWPEAAKVMPIIARPVFAMDKLQKIAAELNVQEIRMPLGRKDNGIINATQRPYYYVFEGET